MPKFIVTKREVWTQGVEIEAATEEEAKQKVFRGEWDNVESLLEYSHTLDSDLWTVEKSE